MREDTAGAAEGKDEQPQSDDDQPAAAAAASGGYAAKRARLAREAAEWENRQKRKLQASGELARLLISCTAVDIVRCIGIC